MIRTGDTIESPITGERVTFLKTSARGGPHGASAPPGISRVRKPQSVRKVVYVGR